MWMKATHLVAKLLDGLRTVLCHGSDDLKVKRDGRALLLQRRSLELDAHRAGGTGGSTAKATEAASLRTEAAGSGSAERRLRRRLRRAKQTGAGRRAECRLGGGTEQATATGGSEGAGASTEGRSGCGRSQPKAGGGLTEGGRSWCGRGTESAERRRGGRRAKRSRRTEWSGSGRAYKRR
jgi:hypothetical protein